MLSSEAKKALNLPNLAPNYLTANLVPVLSDEAKSALNEANINPASAIAGLAPILTTDASKVLPQAKINPSEAAAPVPSADVALGEAATDPAAATGRAAPWGAEALSQALAEATTEDISSSSGEVAAGPRGVGAEVVAAGEDHGALTMALHHDICGQVANGTLSKEGALAAHAALYNVVSPSML